jgi:predicted Zn-dependent peptidase
VVKTWKIYGQPVHKFSLDNGMRIIMQETASPATAINISLRAGMNRDPEELRGLSHYLEHMLFEGTSGRTQEVAAKLMDEEGGHYNAATGVQYVELTTAVINEDLEESLNLIFEMVHLADLRGRRVATERNVVLQEFWEGQDEIEDVVDEEFFKRLLQRHPARFPVIGLPRSVKRIKPSHLQDFYHTFYAPNNIVLSVVGGGIVGGTEGRTRELLENLFGGIEKQHIPRFPVTREPPTKLGSEYFVKKRHLKRAYACLGVQFNDGEETVNIDHPDSYTATIIDTILTGGEKSRLFWLARKKGGHCYGITSEYESFVDLGVFSISFSSAKSRMKKVLDIIYREIEKLKTVLVSEEELNRVKKYIRKTNLMSAMDIDSRAEDFSAYVLFVKQGLSELERNQRKMDAITPEQIRDFARKHFDLNKFCLVAYHP